MWDILGNRVLRADSTGIDAVALASLGHGVVARIKVLAVLQVLGEVVGSGRKLAVKAEKALLFWRQRLQNWLLTKIQINWQRGEGLLLCLSRDMKSVKQRPSPSVCQFATNISACLP